MLSLDGFGIRVVLASSNEFEGVTSSAHYLKELKKAWCSLNGGDSIRGRLLILGAKLKFVFSSWLADSS